MVSEKMLETEGKTKYNKTGVLLLLLLLILINILVPRKMS